MANDTLDSGGTLAALEENCPLCRGSGLDNLDPSEQGRCPVCDGAGSAPTEVGEAVLRLVRHNFRQMFEELIADQ